jgi:hypothetical protein
MHIDPETGYLTPVIYPNDFWLLSDHLVPLNESVTTVPLSLKYEPVGFFKWQMQVCVGPSLPPSLPPSPQRDVRGF